METQDKIDELRRLCDKIKRARLQCSEDDLNGKYKKSFQRIVEEAKATATELLLRAMFTGMHCWDCDTVALDREVNGLIHSGWFAATKEEAGRNIERGDGERVLDWLREVRQKMRLICVRLSDPGPGYIEDKEEYVAWLSDSTSESLEQLTNTKQVS